MIPKNIICTNISAYTLPPVLHRCVERMRNLHPDWNVIFFSDGDCMDFVSEEFPELKDLYYWLPRPVLKADLFRIMAILKLGGFYLDTDFWLYKSLDTLLDGTCVLAWEHTVAEKEFEVRYPSWMRTSEEHLTVANYAFGAVAGHSFLSKVLDELVRRTHSFEAESCTDLDVLHATGPDLFTSVYYEGRSNWSDIRLLAAPYNGLGDYGVHLVNGSWRGKY